MNFNLYNSIILAGIIQGIIFALLVLFSRKYNSRSVYFLMLLIIMFSLSNLQYYFVDIGAMTYSQLFGYFYFPWADATPALLYFYVIWYLYPARKLRRGEFLFFIPIVLSLLTSTVYKVMVWFAGDLESLTDFTVTLRYYVAFYPDLVSGLFGIVAIAILFKEIRQFEVDQRDNNISHLRMGLNWLKITLFIFIVLTAISLWLTLSEMFGDLEISYYPIWIGVSLLIYWLGHIGIYKFGVDQERKAIRQKRKEMPTPKLDVVKPHPIIAQLKTYLIEQKQFLDSQLTLEKTAAHLEMSQGHLSKIINTELQVSFSEYVNSLRVEEAKKYLSDDDFSGYTLVAIGLEAGFNSKSAFNSSFKKRTGTTPSQFKKALGE